jgi:hypothetical protein
MNSTLKCAPLPIYDETRPVPMGSEHSLAGTGYRQARPGYEVRTIEPSRPTSAAVRMSPIIA